MLSHYVVIAWRNLIKNGLFSVINILGLALGLMSCILIMLFVREEIGFDKWLPDSERIVRMHSAYYIPGNPPFLTVRSAGKMMEAVRDYAKNEVDVGVRLIRHEISVRKGDSALPETATFVDTHFFEVFDLPFLHGSKEISLKKPNDLVITEDTAIKYFGKTDVVGEVLTLCCYGPEPSAVTVTGVIKNLPEDTHLDVSLILQVDPAVIEHNQGINTWTSVNVYTYFKMRAGVSLEQFQKRLTYWVNNESPFLAMVKQNFGEYPEGATASDGIKHKLMLLEDLHLRAREDAGNMGDLTPMGDRTLVITFVFVAGLILLIACINFMNLSTARVSHRAREVAMRKVLGASRGQIAVQFLGEAIVLVLMSLMLALMLVELMLPVYNAALGSQLRLLLFSDIKLILLLLGMGLLIGIGAGSYPAFFLSRFSPNTLLRASKGAETASASKVRVVLVVTQFATSIGLIICTFVIYGQTLFAQSIDVGYERDNKIILDIGGARDLREQLKNELMRIPDILSVVFSSEAPTQDNENNNFFTLVDGETTKSDYSNVLLNYHNIDYGFFEAYGVKPIAGRLFNDAYGADEIRELPAGQENQAIASVVLNESALNKFGFTEPTQAIGKHVKTDAHAQYQLRIIGVVPDLYFRSIKFDIRPTVYKMDPTRFNVASLTYKTGNVPELIQKVEAVWKDNIPLRPISLQFLDDMMNAQYAQEDIQVKIFSAFSLLAIVIACLGLYGLAAFTTERKTREIGIRKVMGAGVKDIVGLLIWQFSKPVLLANVIAWPIAMYAMLTWLQSFSYRIDSMWLLPVCFLVGVALLVTAWVTVGGHAAKVALTNPIKALRQE